MRVRRIKQGCCGMIMGGVYPAKWDIRDTYIFVKVGGKWSTSHWFKGFFEIVHEESETL